MAEDDQLTRIQTDIETRLAEYRGRLQSCFHFGLNATARQRIVECGTLINIIQNAQAELRANYRPEDTNAQINEVIRTCNASSTFYSSLSRLGEGIKRRLLAHRWLPRRADVLAVQSQAWNAQHSVIDVIIEDPNTGQDASAIDVQCALQFLGADGQYHPADAQDQNYSNQLARITLTDAVGISSCHPTADGIQSVLGQTNGYFATAGGAGPARRAEAIELATTALDAGTPARVIWLKCTATGDGHSFTLVKKPSGRVDVLEAWANRHGNGYLVGLRDQLKHNLARADAETAVIRLNSPHSGTRDQGYGALSTAYGGANRQPARHFEELNNQGAHDSDANISILCTVRDLAAYATVQGRMRARYGILAGLRNRLGL